MRAYFCPECDNRMYHVKETLYKCAGCGAEYNIKDHGIKQDVEYQKEGG